MQANVLKKYMEYQNDDFGKFDCVMLKLIEMYSRFNIELCTRRSPNGPWEMKTRIGFVTD